MKLEIIEEIDGEIAHFYEPCTNTTLYSVANTFFGMVNGESFKFTLSVPLKIKVLKNIRLIRRLLRFDKSSAVFNYKKDGIIILYQGTMFFYDLQSREIKIVGQLRQCRNVLHSGIAVSENGVYFGEYGHNAERESVPVWSSLDDGRSWSVIYEFGAGTIKHVHGVYLDKFTNDLWIPTGDFEGECYLVNVPQGDFDNITFFGDGTQSWRPVSLFFDEEKICWVMDSQLEDSYLQVFDRRTKKIEKGKVFPGPVWYSKEFTDNVRILATTVEIGPGSTINDANIYGSSDFSNWQLLKSFRKDFFPKRFFKFGVVSFAEGEQDSSDFVIHGEALKMLDGKILKVRIKL